MITLMLAGVFSIIGVEIDAQDALECVLSELSLEIIIVVLIVAI